MTSEHVLLTGGDGWLIFLTIKLGVPNAVTEKG